MDRDRFHTLPLVGGRRRRRRRPRGFQPAAEPRRDRWLQGIAGLLVVSGLTAAAAAPSDFTLLREAYETDGRGLRVGSLVVTPSLEIAGAYDSNVFAAPRGERSDVFVSVMPAVDVESDWPSDAISFRAEGDFRQYATYGRENNNNAAVAGSGRLDLAPNGYLVAGGSFQLLHEDRGALVPVNGINPTQFTVSSGRVGFVVEPSPFGLRLDATIDAFAYENIRLFGGPIIDESGRDRIVYSLQPRLSYRFLPRLDGFVRAVVNRRDYGSVRLPDGLARSSTGYAGQIGGAFRLDESAGGEAYIGHLNQNYRTTVAGALRAFDFGGHLEWRTDRETTFRLDLSRSIEESAMLGSPGYLQTAMRFGAEHTPLPGILVFGSFGYVNADFVGSGAGSDLLEARVGARYALTANVSAGFEYNFRDRTSSAGLPDYARQIIELRVRGQL